MFEHKKICVFGGTGTIGNLIVEYLLNIENRPEVIRIFCNDENSLWEARNLHGINGVRYLLGDIRDYERVKTALKGIDYVFNCAAIKHVPFAEYNPFEAVLTNIFGTNNILRASVEMKVKKLLHISTDKAVEPTTIMGCTKMISERISQMCWAQNPDIDIVVVRLGNVLYSRGSIIPLAKKLKSEGKSISLTDENMERYFMTPLETINFIMMAFKDGHEGEIWVPKLKPQRLMDVITQEIGNDCVINITGCRRGEKIHEKLLFDYEIRLADGMHREYWIIKNDYKVF